ncbi:MAG TPA: hypothetical protein VJU84_08625 [Pyrinomonadaceae bacterium]|nr:hypothetical protein [Pyrinomonadaceae bacterium]
MAKANQKIPAFNGQWVEIFSTGTHYDDAGGKHEIDAAFLDAVVTNLNLDQHEPPAVIGHPQHDAPAYAWGCALRRNGKVLEAQLCDADAQFEEMVRTKKFPKRSASFYLDPKTAPGGQVPALRHIGFLGAAPPAVKGLRDIHFEEGEKATTFEFSEGDAMADDKDTNKPAVLDDKTIGERVMEFLQEKLGVKKDAAAAASFSEADVRKLVDDTVAAVKTEFTTKLSTLEEENKKLKDAVGRQGSSATRAQIVSFCESVGVERMIPALKNMGVVEFMETLASIEDTDDTKVSVVSFSEKDNKEVTEKITPLKWFQNFLQAMPPFVSFGESFGGLKLQGDGSQIVNPKEVEALRDSMGVKKTEAATAAK